jgi:hypothetical protein
MEYAIILEWPRLFVGKWRSSETIRPYEWIAQYNAKRYWKCPLQVSRSQPGCYVQWDTEWDRVGIEN